MKDFIQFAKTSNLHSKRSRESDILLVNFKSDVSLTLQHIVSEYVVSVFFLHNLSKTKNYLVVNGDKYIVSYIIHLFSL